MKVPWYVFWLSKRLLLIGFVWMLVGVGIVANFSALVALMVEIFDFATLDGTAAYLWLYKMTLGGIAGLLLGIQAAVVSMLLDRFGGWK